MDDMEKRKVKFALVAIGCFGLGILATYLGCSIYDKYKHKITWTYPIYKINGETPPGKLQPLVNTSTMLDTKQSDGNRLLVTKGTRVAGTRVAIHVHQYGGHTCVLEGTITDFVEGKPNGIYPAGTCYYMPANTPMSATNLGTEDALLIDTFVLPFGVPPITIMEPGYNE
jgi:quercetin dioxygenase-like cupin family protein